MLSGPFSFSNPIKLYSLFKLILIIALSPTLTIKVSRISVVFKESPFIVKPWLPFLIFKLFFIVLVLSLENIILSFISKVLCWSTTLEETSKLSFDACSVFLFSRRRSSNATSFISFSSPFIIIFSGNWELSD